ncbi:CsiV family protein [Catenovulum sediminis]|uniref:CsiV family protein n=1 Tax=Catenovulum sediminis TaxID=1740262 RepID=A0ABV1RE32_9ALTE|nr:CsiV family protein [Catenovulum sediminis]
MEKIIRALCIAGLLVSSPNVFAERWFEIELLIFSHDSSSDNLQENFDAKIQPIMVNDARDLLSPIYQPDIDTIRNLLPECQIVNPYQPSLQINLHNQELEPQAMSAGAQSDSAADLSTQLVLDLNLASRRKNDFIESLVFPIDAASWHYDFDCRIPEPSMLNPERESLIALDKSLYWAQLPRRVTQTVDEYRDEPYLLNDEHLQFKELAAKFRWRKDIMPLMHLAWRQPVEAENQETPWRIFAGNNYTKEFDYFGEPLIKVDTNQTLIPGSESDLRQPEIVLADEALNHQKILNNIQDVLIKIENKEWSAENALFEKQQEIWLAQQQIAGTPKNVWQLDGLFKIYLRHYLFIETEFNVRKVGPHPKRVLADKALTAKSSTAGFEHKDTFLYPYHFKQNRRIRSGEIHYFDHPEMGIVLQVRRYTKPERPQSDIE